MALMSVVRMEWIARVTYCLSKTCVMLDMPSWSMYAGGSI
jgi:hypothetical protein